MNPARSRPPNQRSLRRPPIAEASQIRRFIVVSRFFCLRIFVDVYVTPVYRGTTFTEKAKGNRGFIMDALWMIVTFVFVFAVLATVGFGFVRMFFLAGATR